MLYAEAMIQIYQAQQSAQREERIRLVKSFNELKKKAPNVRDMIYLDGVIAQIAQNKDELEIALKDN